MSKINDINDLVNATFQVKKFFRDTKKKFNLNYEEIYILNHILRSESNEISSKEIAKCSEFKPYYLTKAFTKAKRFKIVIKEKKFTRRKNSYCLCYRYTKSKYSKTDFRIRRIH